LVSRLGGEWARVATHGGSHVVQEGLVAVRVSTGFCEPGVRC
jgi:hypothetical protein